MASNLPPGVNENMIPGNRPEDLEDEHFFNGLDKRFKDLFPKENEVISHLLENDMSDDAIWRYVLMARDMGYERGYSDGMRDAEEERNQDASDC